MILKTINPSENKKKNKSELDWARIEKKNEKSVYRSPANTQSKLNKPKNRPEMLLHHQLLDLRHVHVREIGRRWIKLIGIGRCFLAPLLPGLILLVVNHVVEIVRYVDSSLPSLGKSEKLAIEGEYKGQDEKNEEEEGFGHG